MINMLIHAYLKIVNSASDEKLNSKFFDQRIINKVFKNFPIYSKYNNYMRVSEFQFSNENCNR